MGGGGWEELAVVGGAELGGRGALDCYRNKILNKAHHTKSVFGGCSLTADRMAGSCGGELGSSGISLTFKSLISLPRKIINSYTSLRGGISLEEGLFSVPKERTGQDKEKKNIFSNSIITLNNTDSKPLARVTVDSLVSTW